MLDPAHVMVAVGLLSAGAPIQSIEASRLLVDPFQLRQTHPMLG